MPDGLSFAELQTKLGFSKFDPNEGVAKGADTACRIQSLPDFYMGAASVDEYANYFTDLSKAHGGLGALAKTIYQAHQVPPSVQTFTKISYMPNAQTQQFGVLQWPGLPPEVLEKLSREHPGPQMIVSNRVDAIIKYSQPSSKPWEPGWQIVPRDDDEYPSAHTKREMREASQFLLQGGYGNDFEKPRDRDRLLRVDFTKFLSEIVRNSLTFDGIAIWTEWAKDDQVLSFAPLPAQNIRLLARPDRPHNPFGINQAELDFYGDTTSDDAIERRARENNQTYTDYDYAVAVDESGNIVQKFNRKQLIWYTRNPRLDVQVGGYGYPELEMALTLVVGFTNAIQFNADIFDKNAIPKAILALKGNFTQRQLDAMGRVWDNLQRGPRSDWSLPAIQVSEKGAIDLISLEPLRKESAYYQYLVNLFMGALATMYRFPPHRLGYKISGTERDPRPDMNKQLLEEDDIGMPVLLIHIENIINTYLLGRWPHLKLKFTGKTPKEDARLYEAWLNSLTLGEQRRLTGQPPLIELADSDAAKEAAEILDLCPVNPSLVGVYQAWIAARAKGFSLHNDPAMMLPGAGMNGDGPGANDGLKEQPGARYKPKKDPAKSEAHGHASGVRRNSRQEEKNTGHRSKVPNLRQWDATDYTRVDRSTPSRSK